ncbi:MAG: HutD family protein [Peptoniphilus sp.]|nr:HutD family protein [Peptoniphilus sp.]
MKIIERKDFKSSPWAGGETDEIIIFPEGADFKDRTFEYRISSATCNLDSSKFSPYNGYKRFITPLDYDLILKNSGEDLTVKPFEIYEFSGSDDVSSYSKVRDFNLILKEDLAGELFTEEVRGELHLKNDVNTLIAFNYDGDLEVEDKKLNPMSAFLLGEGEEAKVKGTGKLLISKIKK